MKISVVSPSNRIDGLKIVAKCLANQTFRDFEWLVCAPHNTQYDKGIKNYRYFEEPKKKEGDFYNLNKAWNKLFQAARGELIVSIVDYTSFEPKTLEKLWKHYTDNPCTLVSGIGFQYENNKLVWVDPRYPSKKLSFLSPVDMEFRLASIPRAAIYAVGGIDEEYDKVVALSEKELCSRIATLGYFFILDFDISYQFLKHEDHGKEWDKRYKKGKKLLVHHFNEIAAGKRSNLHYVDW